MFYHTVYKSVRLLLVAAFFIVLSPGESAADELSDQRARIGLDLFPSVLAADKNIEGKKCDDGTLKLILVHAGRENFAEEMAAELKRINEIRGIPIRISIVEIHELEKTTDCQTAGVFLVERITGGMEAVIRFGGEQHAIVFSPFPGDVEDGVPSGMLITDRILPYVNVDALRLYDVHLKSFFLKIAVQYGD